MVTCIVIPQNEHTAVEERTFNGLSDFQSAVGGWIEPIHIERPSVTLFINEEGKIRHLPVNARATALWWLFNPAARGVDVIVGEAVLVGSRGGRGSTTELGHSFRTLLLGNGKYHLETAAAKGRWQRDPRDFDTFFEAAIYAATRDRSEDVGILELGARVVAD